MWLFLALACTRDPDPVETFDTLGTAEALAAEGVAEWGPDEHAFDWIPTVWAYGLHRLHANGGDPAVSSDWYRAWIDDARPRFVGGDSPFVSSDSMSPALLASIATIEDPAFDTAAITDAAHAYLATAPRTDEGAIEHWTEAATFGTPGQVWVDSQFMFGLFLLSEHDRTGDAAHLDLAVEQYRLFSELCRDDATQLYRHAYDDATDANIPTEAVFWARGNAWVLISGVEILARMEAGDARRAEIEALVRAHADALVATQDPDDGLWHTVLNDPVPGDPANYTETSASALIAFALHRGGEDGLWGHEAAVAAAVGGIEARIFDTGGGLVLTGTSFGTNPGDYDYYVGIGTADDLMLGVGSVVMLLAEVDGATAIP